MATRLRFCHDLAERVRASRFRAEVREINLSRTGRDRDTEADPKLDGRTLCAWHRTRMVGTIDVHWGGDRALPEDRALRLGVADVVHGASERLVVVLDESILHPDHRGHPIDLELKAGAARFAAQQQARWVFASCVLSDTAPHRAMGFVPCGAPADLPGVGHRVPVVLDLANLEHLQRVRSPFVEEARRLQTSFVDDEDDDVEVDETDAWREVYRLTRAAREANAAFLGGLQGDDAARMLLDGGLLSPVAGQCLVAQGERGRDLFLVLAGAVDVRCGGRTIAVLGPGEVFGEIGFLLEAERTADVVAAGPDVKVLRLTEERLRGVMAEHPRVAAEIALGISRGLCLKLIAAGEG